jgi:hypothetical protein
MIRGLLADGWAPPSTATDTTSIMARMRHSASRVLLCCAGLALASCRPAADLDSGIVDWIFDPGDAHVAVLRISDGALECSDDGAPGGEYLRIVPREALSDGAWAIGEGERCTDGACSEIVGGSVTFGASDGDARTQAIEYDVELEDGERLEGAATLSVCPNGWGA